MDEPADNALAGISATPSWPPPAQAQLDAVVASAFFGAEARATAEGLVTGLETALKQEGDDMPYSKTATAPPTDTLRGGALKDRVWVTRQGVQIDRIASAWLISPLHRSRCALLKFVPGTGYAPQAGESALRHVRRRVHVTWATAAPSR